MDHPTVRSTPKRKGFSAGIFENAKPSERICGTRLLPVRQGSRGGKMWGREGTFGVGTVEVGAQGVALQNSTGVALQNATARSTHTKMGFSGTSRIRRNPQMLRFTSRSLLASARSVSRTALRTAPGDPPPSTTDFQRTPPRGTCEDPRDI